MKLSLLLILGFICGKGVSQQHSKTPVSAWIEFLSNPDDKNNKWYDTLGAAVGNADSAGAFALLNQVQQQLDENNRYAKARFNCLKTATTYIKSLSEIGVVRQPRKVKEEVKKLLREALDAAYECNDDYLIAFVSGCYGSTMLSLKETEPAVMYLTQAIDLNEKIKKKGKESMYIALGEILWSIREYEKCISYTQSGFSQLMASSFYNEEAKDLYTMFCSNTIGLACYKLGRYDSAFFYYNKALQAQPKVNKPVWKGIISGNMAQIYFAQGNYKAALPLFQTDYSLSKQYGLYDNAANALEWMARINLTMGKKDSALAQVRAAFGFLQKFPDAVCLRNIYYTASGIFKALNNNDSSFFYAGLYNTIRDSIERVVYQSGVNIARLRLAEEKNRFSIVNLQREKQEQIRQRNFIIAAIVAVSCLVLLLISRRNQKLKFKQQLNEQEKMRIKQEMQSAKDQLQLFTQSLIDKTELIEKLEQQMQASTYSAERQESLSTLSSLTILTDEDWIKFKTLFDKIYPLFFQQLKSKSPDITLAEQRMAALTRLQLTTKQMASMQGVSTDSVHKTRQRLRQRLGISNEVNLEEYISRV